MARGGCIGACLSRRGKRRKQGLAVKPIQRLTRVECSSARLGWREKRKQGLAVKVDPEAYMVPRHHQAHLPHEWEAHKGVPDGLTSSDTKTILPICPSVIMSSPRSLTVRAISISYWMTQICSVQTNQIYPSVPSDTRSLPRDFSTTWFGDKHNVRAEKL